MTKTKPKFKKNQNVFCGIIRGLPEKVTEYCGSLYVVDGRIIEILDFVDLFNDSKCPFRYKYKICSEYGMFRVEEPFVFENPASAKAVLDEYAKKVDNITAAYYKKYNADELDDWFRENIMNR